MYGDSRIMKTKGSVHFFLTIFISASLMNCNKVTKQETTNDSSELSS